jgi:inner membrane transporter RhtA
VRERAVAGTSMIVCTSLSIQLAAAIAHDLFDRLGRIGVSAMRFALGAVILLAIVRPAIRGRDAATWGAIAAYGASLAALNNLPTVKRAHLPLLLASDRFARTANEGRIACEQKRD